MIKGMVKKLTAGLLTALMAVTLVSCGGETKETSAGNESTFVSKIKDSGKIILGTNPEFPPFEFTVVENGQSKTVGADILFAEEIAKELGVKLEIKEMKFSGLLDALNAGNIDMVIAGMNPTPERKQNVEFSELYYQDSPQVLLINNSKADKIKGVNDLNGLVVGAQKGTVQEEVVKNEIKGSTLKAIDKIPDLIQNLKNNNIDALVLEKPVAEEWIKKNSKDISIAPFEIGVDYSGYAVAIKKGNTDLVEVVNKVVERMKTEKLMDKFVEDAKALNPKE